MVVVLVRRRISSTAVRDRLLFIAWGERIFFKGEYLIFRITEGEIRPD